MGLKLSMTCCPYDRARALIEGSVKPEDIDLEIVVNPNDRTRQSQARDGKFDIAEFYAGIYIADLPQRSFGFTAIPIFVKRMFRHSYIYINKRAGVSDPRDLNGRKVGILARFNTASLWVRGLLEDDYGVDLKSITWVAEQTETVPGWEPPSWLKLEIVPKGATLYDLITSGAIDACITTKTWAPNIHPDIDFLFPRYAELERDYFKRTGYFPIMHTLVIKTAILEKHPWVAMSMFNAWMESKQRCYEWLEWQRIHMTSMWFRALWEEERAAAGPDIYPWGFKRTRAEVDKMLDYAYREGMTPRKFDPENMFHRSTLKT